MSDQKDTTQIDEQQTVSQPVNVDLKTNHKKEKDDDQGLTDERDVRYQTVVVKGKKKKKKEPFLRGGRGQAHIKATYNNTIVTITDLNGAVLVWASAGKQGFKGPKKSTPYAAGVIVKSLVDKAKSFAIKELDVFVKGVGTGREAAVRALSTNGFQIVSIKDVTPIPHGGCRPKKPRRV